MTKACMGIWHDAERTAKGEGVDIGGAPKTKATGRCGAAPRGWDSEHTVKMCGVARPDRG